MASAVIFNASNCIVSLGTLSTVVDTSLCLSWPHFFTLFCHFRRADALDRKGLNLSVCGKTNTIMLPWRYFAYWVWFDNNQEYNKTVIFDSIIDWLHLLFTSSQFNKYCTMHILNISVVANNSTIIVWHNLAHVF